MHGAICNQCIEDLNERASVLSLIRNKKKSQSNDANGHDIIMDIRNRVQIALQILLNGVICDAYLSERNIIICWTKSLIHNISASRRGLC